MEERGYVLAGYGLFLLGLVTGGLTALIGVILAHLRLDGARGSAFESHYKNLILVFWVWLSAMLIAGALAFASLAGFLVSLFAPWPGHMFGLFHAGAMLGLVFLGVLIVTFWCYWRLLRGFFRALDDKPYRG